MKIKEKQNLASTWFENLRDQICSEFEKIEQEYLASPKKHFLVHQDPKKLKFKRTSWQRDGGGGGVMSSMKGNVFEKVGVNISTVFGELSEQFRQQIPGASDNANFWASGISLVAHMCSPLVPAVHFNTRFINTQKEWFGGGMDLNPMYENDQDTAFLHENLQKICDKYDPKYYEKFKKNCDEYFYIKHRNESRGVGGIFYDYQNSDDFDTDFAFTQDVGKGFLEIFVKIVRQHMFEEFNEEQRKHQLLKRGRYVEFNLIYDRGTKFGLMTNGNPDAILMSLPPVAHWD